MPAVTIAQMRNRVRIEKKVIAGQAVTWALRAVVNAAIEPLSYAERMSTQQLTGTLNSALRMRYRSDLAITDRVRFGARTLNIITYSDPFGDQVETRMVTSEVQA